MRSKLHPSARPVGLDRHATTSRLAPTRKSTSCPKSADTSLAYSIHQFLHTLHILSANRTGRSPNTISRQTLSQPLSCWLLLRMSTSTTPHHARCLLDHSATNSKPTLQQKNRCFMPSLIKQSLTARASQRGAIARGSEAQPWSTDNWGLLHAALRRRESKPIGQPDRR